METFAVGDAVQITRGVMRGEVGTVVRWYEDGQTWLVRVGSTQDHHRPDEFEHVRP